MGFHSPLIRPAISRGGSFGGGTLDSHDGKRLLEYPRLFSLVSIMVSILGL